MAGRRMWHTCLPPRRATRRLLRDSTENRGSVETGDAGGEAWAAAAAKGGTSTVRQQQFMEQNTPHNHNSENSTERRERERQASLLVFFFFFTDWGTRTGAVGEWWVLQTKQKATLARRLIINSENSNHKFFREKRQVSLSVDFYRLGRTRGSSSHWQINSTECIGNC